MKLKIVFFLSFFILTVTLTAKSIINKDVLNVLLRKEKIFLWKKIDKNRDQKKLFKIIKKNSDMLSCLNKDMQTKKHILTFFHFYDINQDGFLDIIYDGPCMPYPQVMIFINQKKINFQNIYNKPGKINFIKKEGKYSKIIIIKKSCCCDFYNTKEYLKIPLDKISKKPQKLKIYSLKESNYHNTPPNDNILFKNFFKISQKTFLRLSPIIIN